MDARLKDFDPLGQEGRGEGTIEKGKLPEKKTRASGGKGHRLSRKRRCLGDKLNSGDFWTDW